MRTVTAVVNGTKTTWIEASEFRPERSLRLWVERSLPQELQRYTAEIIPSKPRGGEPNPLSETRAFVMEPKGFRGARPAWAPEPEELEFDDNFSLGQAAISADGYYKPYRTSGPLLVGWCDETQRWLAAALEDDWQNWSLNMSLLFGSGYRQVSDKAVWRLPS